MGRCQPKLLTPYHDGELDDGAMGEMDDHLRGCASCAAVLDDVRIAAGRVRGMGRAAIPVRSLRPALAALAESAGLDDGAFDRPAAWAAAAEAPVVALGAGALEEEAMPVLEDVEPAPDLAAEAVWVGHDEPAWAPRREPPEFEPAMEVEAELEPPAMGTAEPEPPAMGAPEPVPPAGTFEVETEPDHHRPTFVDLPAEGTAALSLPELAEPDPEGGEPEPHAAEPAVPATFDSGPSAAAVDEPEPPAAVFNPQPLPEAEPPLTPPWMDGAELEAADLDAEGRRAVDEAMAPALAEPAETAGGVEPEPEPEEPPLVHLGHLPPEVEPATAETDDDLPAEPEDAEAGEEAERALARLRREMEPRLRDADLAVSRAARRARPRRVTIIDRLAENAVVVGVVAAGVILLGGAVIGVRALSHQHPVATTTPQPGSSSQPGTTVPGGGGATPAASPQPSTPAGLSDVVTAGAGGQGFDVARVRSGVPGAGVFRLVFDLTGTGAFPDVRLGRQADGSLRLVASGIAASPTVITAWTPPPGSTVTAVTAVSGTGLDLKLTLASPASYSVVYVAGSGGTSPRLVLDFK